MLRYAVITCLFALACGAPPARAQTSALDDFRKKASATRHEGTAGLKATARNPVSDSEDDPPDDTAAAVPTDQRCQKSALRTLREGGHCGE